MQNQINTLLTQNASLQNQMNNLTNIVDSCCNIHQQERRQNRDNGIGGDNDNSINTHDVVLSSQDAQLFQNFPDPFSGATKIRYFIPQNVVSAEILFFDEYGNNISTNILSERGNIGELNIDATTLAAGTYLYSLVIDGKIISTKHMAHTK